MTRRRAPRHARALVRLFLRVFALTGCLVVLSIRCPVVLAAQPGPVQSSSSTVEMESGPDGAWDGTFLAANAFLGAITAGVSRALAGESFWAGFGRGAVGGSIAFWGKKVTGSRVWGAGLAGRQLHAVGIAVTRSGAAGHGLLDSVIVPLGPLRVDVGRAPGPDRPRVRVSLADAVALGWAVSTSELSFDGWSSLSAGALVFEARYRTIEVGGTPIRGATVGGVVLLSGLQHPDGMGPYGPARAEAFAHERVHVLQHDFVEQLWMGPLERRLVGRIPGADRMPAWIEPDLLGMGVTGLTVLLGRGRGNRAPWEFEARALGGR